MNAPDRLVILDYSGTLSLTAPRFAKPGHLVRELAESGLAALGVATPEAFWERIINPTWTEGSKTRRGYAAVMTERILAIGMAPGAARKAVAAAADRFVASYLSHSRIDPRWRPVLASLASSRTAVTVVATDHYAEATAAIGRFLGEQGVLLFVANSADLGAWKGERRFWEALRERLPLAAIRRLLLIDDFGLHEEQRDSYGASDKVLPRQQQTLAVLREAFGIEAEAVPFVLDPSLWGDSRAESRLIAATAARIAAFLEGR
jgi:hypothetical protein